MIVLDTDHVSVLKYSEHPRAKHLAAKLEARPVGEAIGLTIVTVEEQMRGWLAAVAKERRPHRQVLAYLELQRLFEYFSCSRSSRSMSRARTNSRNSARPRSGLAPWI
jgi:tRNA(fMet)-specific endonuclease VapC